MHGDIHVYDDDAGILYLADGREISVNPRCFSSVDQAIRELAKWAKGRNLIGADDDVAAFVI
ncbi:hypothetical protein [Marinobacterium aestuariivivens]|uniref:Uncharacterized protein n=1 Tax=Marinobacterium aestuariivivens TaxID=1698799 RepID=A0ABW2A9R7_9GAMM